jgi:hypothetical protein
VDHAEEEDGGRHEQDDHDAGAERRESAVAAS